MNTRSLQHNHRPPTDPTELQSAKGSIAHALVDTAHLVRQYAPGGTGKDPGHKVAGVYVGSAGTTMMDYNIAMLDLPDLRAPDLFAAGDACLALTLPLSRSSQLSGSDCSFIQTYVGNWVLVLHRLLQTPKSDVHRALDVEWPQAAEKLQDVVVRKGGHRSDVERPKAAEKLQDVVVRINGPPRSIQDIDEIGNDGCEVLNGLSGLLYALLFLRSSLASSNARASVDVKATVGRIVEDAKITALVNIIVSRGKAGAITYAAQAPKSQLTPSLMWSWRNRRYLGAAHGIVGILHMLLLCPSKIITPHVPLILQTVEWIVGLQAPSGNWPSRAPEAGASKESLDNDLVHWCHGAPGVVMLLSLVLRRSRAPNSPITLPQHLPDMLTASLKRGASLIYTFGLLRKGVGVCHGVGGAVFALLAVADATADMPGNDHNVVGPRALSAAVHLAHLAVDYASRTHRKEMRTPDRPWSLYEGAAGMCCAWAEVLRRMNGARRGLEVGCGMPAYDDLAF